jgi:hypothetical protein
VETERDRPRPQRLWCRPLASRLGMPPVTLDAERRARAQHNGSGTARWRDGWQRHSNLTPPTPGDGRSSRRTQSEPCKGMRPDAWARMNSLSGTTASPRQDHVTMATEPPQSPVTEAVRGLEVRWIFPGQLEAQVAGWFARFPARMSHAKTSTCSSRLWPGCRSRSAGAGTGDRGLRPRAS